MDTNRTALRFPEAVGHAFAFMKEYGFVCEEETPTIVKFRRGDLVANVYHGRASYELGFEIGPVEDPLPMYLILRLSDPELAARYRKPTATTAAAVAAALPGIAALVRRHGEPALRGDTTFFAALYEQGRASAEAYALDGLMLRTRPKAEHAFRQKRYAEAAALYEQIEAHLTPAERKKLELAQKRRQLA